MSDTFLYVYTWISKETKWKSIRLYLSSDKDKALWQQQYQEYVKGIPTRITTYRL